MGRRHEVARAPLCRSAQSARPANSGAGRGSDAPRGAEGIAARRLRGPARLGPDRSAESPTSASLFASSSNGCRPLSANATPSGVGRRRLPPAQGGRSPRRGLRSLSRRRLEPRGHARCARHRLRAPRGRSLPCPGSNRGSRGRRGSPNRCSCTGCSTFKPQPSYTNARSRDHARPLRIFA